MAGPSLDDVDLYSLPPALRRKLFSNVERFRLEQKRLARTQQQRYDDPHPSIYYQPAITDAGPPTARSSKARSIKDASAPPNSRHGFASARRRIRSKNHRRQLLLNAGWKSSARLQKSSSPASPPFLLTQADSEWFRSLPLKIQQQQFSEEEQAYLLANWRSSVILDAADKALYRLGHQHPSHRRHSVTSIASAPTLSSSASTMASSAHPADSAVDVRSSLYDSFRWLDEEDELDLSLDNYHYHIADSTATKAHIHQRKPSFRRTFSFQSSQRNARNDRPATSTALNTAPRSPPTSQSFSRPFPSQRPRAPSFIRRHDRSFSQSFSNTAIFNKHAPKTSVTSIEQPAQYYQDPEARLKLRVYLASPQKFDEAVEFGFPALESPAGSDKENRPSTERKPKAPQEPATFFKDESTSYLEDISPTTSSRLDMGFSPALQPFQPSPRRQSDSATVNLNRQTRTPHMTARRLSQHLTGGREMTLKMTLTRADLRTADSIGSPRLSGPDDPLRLADLPAPDQSKPVWDAPDHGNVVKKMWRKLRGR